MLPPDLRGSVLVVPYPLLNQPHEGCDVVELCFFQHACNEERSVVKVCGDGLSSDTVLLPSVHRLALDISCKTASPM